MGERIVPPGHAVPDVITEVLVANLESFSEPCLPVPARWAVPGNSLSATCHSRFPPSRFRALVPQVCLPVRVRMYHYSIAIIQARLDFT